MPPSLLDVLLEAVHETPADDTPLLVLADWCQDQDDPLLQARGEFMLAFRTGQGESQVERRAWSCRGPARGR